MRLEIEELEVVCPFIPFVLLVVNSGSGQTGCLVIRLESLLNTEVQIVAERCTILRAL